MGAAERIQRGFGRLTLVAGAVTGVVVGANVVMAAHSWWLAEHEGIDLIAALQDERNGKLSYVEEAFLQGARERKLIPPKWANAPPVNAPKPPPGFEIVSGDAPTPQQAQAFVAYVKEEQRWDRTKPQLEIAAVVGIVGTAIAAAIWACGWVLSGFFT